jgi:predicted acylesterase/phospholipase RssA
MVDPVAESAPVMSTGDGGSMFDAVVFSGGGCRCFWQLGFWSVVAPELRLQPGVMAAVSAGAAFATAALLDVIDVVLEDFKRRTAANRRNAYPRNALRGDPIFPHESMYRGAILSSLEGVSMDRLQTGADLRILMARPPIWSGRRVGFALSCVAFALDRYELRVHARWGQRFGFTPEVVSARACRSADELASLILHSSCTPPLLPLYRRGERIVLDGGLIDNAPAAWVGEARSTLVLLTRHYEKHALPRVVGRTYVCPSREVPIVKWDYTSPSLIQQTFDLGRRDGEAFVRAAVGASEHEMSGVLPRSESRLAG